MSALLSGPCLTRKHTDCGHIITTSISHVFVACECTCHPTLTEMEIA